MRAASRGSKIVVQQSGHFADASECLTMRAKAFESVGRPSRRQASSQRSDRTENSILRNFGSSAPVRCRTGPCRRDEILSLRRKAQQRQIAVCIHNSEVLLIVPSQKTESRDGSDLHSKHQRQCRRPPIQTRNKTYESRNLK